MINQEMPRYARIAAGTCLALFIFYPRLLPDAIPTRVMTILLVGAVLAFELWTASRLRGPRLLRVACVPLGAGPLLLSVESIAAVLNDRLFAVNAEHFLIIAPMMAIVGWIVVRERTWKPYAYTLLAVAVVTAILAVAESLLGFSLFNRAEFVFSQREGSTRALLGAEHVLVLGALLAVATPFAALLKLRTRVPATVILLAGCWASGSRAALGLAATVAVLQLFPAVVTMLRRFRIALVALVSVSLVTLGVLAFAVWDPYIAGDTGAEYSANYRFASYALLPDLLSSRPLGYLLGSPPHGIWMMESELRGPVDLAVSADSEVVFAAFALGWVGIFTYAGVLILGVLAIGPAPVLGLALTLFTALGVIMSLHSWDAASLLWYALIGACVAAATDSSWKFATPWTKAGSR